jgi:hypothetical protein
VPAPKLTVTSTVLSQLQEQMPWQITTDFKMRNCYEGAELMRGLRMQELEQLNISVDCLLLTSICNLILLDEIELGL